MGNIEVEAYLRESKVKDRTRILSVGGVNQALRATDYKDPTKIFIPIRITGMENGLYTGILDLSVLETQIHPGTASMETCGL